MVDGHPVINKGTNVKFNVVTLNDGNGYLYLPAETKFWPRQYFHKRVFVHRGGVSNFSGGLQFFGGVIFLGGWGIFFDFCFLWGYTTPPPPDQTLEYGQRSAGTHPTGMHSCLELSSSFSIKNKNPFTRLIS